jgi:hypothetical protein
MAKSPRRLITPRHNKFDPTKSPLNEFGPSGSPAQYPYDVNASEIPFDSTQFHVNYLKNQFSDLARPNLFKIDLLPPESLINDMDMSVNSLLGVLAKSTKIPSMTAKDYVYQRAGQKLYIPTGEMEHGDASITFYNDSDFILRSLFNRWMRLGVHNWDYNIGAVPSLALAGQVTIYHFDYSLKPTYSVVLTNAWPKTVSEIELSQDDENKAEEFTVDFNYTSQLIYKSYKDEE